MAKKTPQKRDGVYQRKDRTKPTKKSGKKGSEVMNDEMDDERVPYEVDFKRVNELIEEIGLRTGSIAMWQSIHGHAGQADIDLLRRLVREIDGLLQGEQ